MKSPTSHMFSIAALISNLVSAPSHSLVILSDRLRDMEAISILDISHYTKSLCKNCTNDSILPRAWHGVRNFTESKFAHIIMGETYLPNPNDMLRRMHSLFKALKKAADQNDGVYELTLLREIISNQEFFAVEFVGQIADIAQQSMIHELDTKVRLFEKNGVSPSDAEVLKEMGQRDLGHIFLNRFFTQTIEQFSLGAKFGEPGPTLYAALKDRLKALEAANAPS